MLPIDRNYLRQSPDGTIHFDGPMPMALFAGSFNPLHEGHRQLAAAAARKLGVEVVFEISMLNVDKPELPHEEVRRRLDQFRGVAAIYVTRAPTFEQKATLFPGSTLIVGSDTAERIVSPRYYTDDDAARDRSLARIESLGCRFLVAGRMNRSDRFVTLDGIAIPEKFRHLFDAISPEDFRVDISSTLIRQRRG